MRVGLLRLSRANLLCLPQVCYPQVLFFEELTTWSLQIQDVGAHPIYQINKSKRQKAKHKRHPEEVNKVLLEREGGVQLPTRLAESVSIRHKACEISRRLVALWLPSTTASKAASCFPNMATDARIAELPAELRYLQYDSSLESQYLPAIRALISKDLSEPYSIYVYRYFLYQWGDLCFMAGLLIQVTTQLTD